MGLGFSYRPLDANPSIRVPSEVEKLLGAHRRPWPVHDQSLVRDHHPGSVNRMHEVLILPVENRDDEVSGSPHWSGGRKGRSIVGPDAAQSLVAGREGSPTVEVSMTPADHRFVGHRVTSTGRVIAARLQSGHGEPTTRAQPDSWQCRAVWPRDAINEFLSPRPTEERTSSADGRGQSASC